MQTRVDDQRCNGVGRNAAHAWVGIAQGRLQIGQRIFFSGIVSGDVSRGSALFLVIRSTQNIADFPNICGC